MNKSDARVGDDDAEGLSAPPSSRGAEGASLQERAMADCVSSDQNVVHSSRSPFKQRIENISAPNINAHQMFGIGNIDNPAINMGNQGTVAHESMPQSQQQYIHDYSISAYSHPTFPPAVASLSNELISDMPDSQTLTGTTHASMTSSLDQNINYNRNNIRSDMENWMTMQRPFSLNSFGRYPSHSQGSTSSSLYWDTSTSNAVVPHAHGALVRLPSQPLSTLPHSGGHFSEQMNTSSVSALTNDTSDLASQPASSLHNWASRAPVPAYSTLGPIVGNTSSGPHSHSASSASSAQQASSMHALSNPTYKTDSISQLLDTAAPRLATSSSGLPSHSASSTSTAQQASSMHGSGAQSYGSTSSSISQLLAATTGGTTSSSALPSQSVSSASNTQSLATHQINPRHPTHLAIPTDHSFLDPVHIFLRSTCIELFVSTREDTGCTGRGARASKEGQVGLRCAFCKDMPHDELPRQAICYPSKRDTIFESVRNYQRVHLADNCCPMIPDDTKANYKSISKDDNPPNKKSQRFVKAYYSEAAIEIGIVETSKGLVFGAPPNISGTPSENLMAVIRAAEDPSNASAFWEHYKSSRGKPELRKFAHLASAQTREVILNARREPSAFVHPQDFPSVSDFEFLLFKQVNPCRPSAKTLKRRGINPSESTALSGLRCKHCALVHRGETHHKGMWFPLSSQSLSDSSFSQSLFNHMATCSNVPQAVKDAFGELKLLASEHNVTTKRGSRKKFLEKIWERMNKYYE